MIKILITAVAASLVSITASAQIIQSKIIDKGGSGPYPAIAATERTLTDYVVYRPKDLQAASNKEGPLPVLAFGNGGCMDSSITHERLLSEVASHGYVIVAIGALQLNGEREVKSTPSSMLVDAMDWLEQRAGDKGSDYYNRIDLQRLGVMGQSCGGAQVLVAAKDKRVRTSVMFNAGIGDMTMAGANADSLKHLHAPILYVIGGPEEVAHPNAGLDYDRLQHVPVVFADLADGGHMGTFAEAYGGSFTKVTLAWLDWQLKQQAQYAPLFLDGKLATTYDGWSVKAKNFNNKSHIKTP